MNSILNISDSFITSIDWNSGVLTVLKESDQLLRRFGQVDVVDLGAKNTLEVRRIQADEIWAIISGKAEIELEDQRGESPSFGKRVDMEVEGKSPQVFLVPFGVNCKISSQEGAILLRISTHQDGTHPEDRTVLG